MLVVDPDAWLEDAWQGATQHQVHLSPSSREIRILRPRRIWLWAFWVLFKVHCNIAAGYVCLVVISPGPTKK